MKILGLNLGHDGSCALVVDGKLVGAIATERVTRKKKADGVDVATVEYLLNNHKLQIDDIDIVSYSHFENTPMPLPKYFTNETFEVHKDFFGHNKKFIHVPHHLAHCSSAYYTSNLDNAICLSIDSSVHFFSDVNSSICIGDGNKIYFEKVQGTMIGSAYSQFTEQLGFGPANVKAGSLMGMAAYGKIPQYLINNIDYYISKTYGFASDSEWCDVNQYIQFMKDWLEDNSFIPSGNINDFNTMNLAAGIQYLFEKTILDIVQKDLVPYDQENLCLSGGSFLNCNTNSAIKSLNIFKNIHHFPACGDDGIAVGTALYVAHHLYDEPRHTYEENEIALLGNSHSVSEPDYDLIVDQIIDGKVIAWFMDRSEFGPRALGSRSILADPRLPQNKDILNFVIKKREWFRPFAPVVLEEEASNWFSPGDPSPYMLYTQQVLKPELVPSITHIDGTARIQTINESFNPYLYRLIKKFYERTGVPMLINTSLNGNGQPILETIDDAEKFFENNKNIFTLVLNGDIISRNE